MDLNAVTAVLSPRSRRDLAPFAPGDAWLAGATWLFSEPQPDITRLIDLAALDWPPLVVTDAGLSIAATCTIATLETFEPPRAWRAAPLFGECCRSFLASFKIQAAATVGGNLCTALPAGPMIALSVALDGICTLWAPDGGTRAVPARDFVLGPQTTVLGPGELLRSVDLPSSALQRRAVFRRISLTPLGRSAALLIGTLDDAGSFALTITAATPRPVRLDFATIPTATDLRERIEAAIQPGGYYDDVHGAPDWRQRMTLTFADEIRTALS